MPDLICQIKKKKQDQWKNPVEHTWSLANDSFSSGESYPCATLNIAGKDIFLTACLSGLGFLDQRMSSTLSLDIFDSLLVGHHVGCQIFTWESFLQNLKKKEKNIIYGVQQVQVDI